MAMAELHAVKLEEALFAQLQKEAATRNESVDEVVRDALTAHVSYRAWMEMVDEARERTQQLGIREEDVNDIVAQFRRGRGE
jgi:plasmid stability protein